MVLKGLVTRLGMLTWVLIYGGLLLLGLGLSMQRANRPESWYVAATGIGLALLGVLLVWARSRQDDSSDR